MQINQYELTKEIKQEAKRLGFDSCGVSKAEELTEEAKILEAWLNQPMQGKMSYMANHFDKRTNPQNLVEGAKSVISLSFNYYTDKKQRDIQSPKIAMYALGNDYHDFIRDRLNNFVQFIRQKVGEISIRSFVDSAPVMERVWAQRGGIGWVGKNSNILSKRKGSYFFLAEIILDVALEYDSPVKDYCGACTQCIDACPTDAIYEPYKVDASKCISYFTIELKDEILPEDYKGKFENWMFGCDICQQVCPINSQSTRHQEPELEPSEQLLNMTRQDWEDLNEETFKQLFRLSPIKRTKFKGLKRNINFLFSK
ncbi:MAG: tRNA epoxyqueuosine(34) reductase QueG [Bacteroidetes bacterium]|nr:tRNA epoxyqueuosine(34) reductase QueG [Bacteroidota bacterium]